MKVLHLPVLQTEVLDMLSPKPNGIYVDATIGPGGHAEQIMKCLGPAGRLIGIDRDEDALKIAGERLSDERVVLMRGEFSEVEGLLSQAGISQVDGILFDLGLSMVQIRDPLRGFSFLSDERLDMRMDKGQNISAWDVVNRYSGKEIERVLREFGEERLARKIAQAIVNQRGKKTIDTCSGLAKIVAAVYGSRGKVHPATKTFQALRIEVNRELNQLATGLDASVRLLRKGGRVCVISYHSLEDRKVKHFFAENAKKGVIKILTKKPLTSGQEERRANPSSRSAKLRAAEKYDV
ncbi:MAG: 16S rRNA (cytosine(1402)-N(4))-methyltransferase RsmH [Thermodesulfovibrionales bacterium]|nr:16S rRNA (cytosine(1402)-N(4))-methyltransferase RsmH [Thermodesulfovibrionales bacterium]